MVIDPTSSIGKLRLRTGDFSDLPVFPDTVYQSALDDCKGSIPKAATLCAQYILAALTSQTHQKLSQVEVYGAEYFQNYLAFLKATILNPNFMDICPMPYVASIKNEFGETVELPLVQFQKDWTANYVRTTQSQDMHMTALAPSLVPNDPFNVIGGYSA